MKGITVSLHDVQHKEGAYVEFEFVNETTVNVKVVEPGVPSASVQLIPRQLETVIRAMGYKMVREG